MSFFKKIFGKAENKSTQAPGPMPTRGINFKYPPIPENGPKIAQQFVDAVKDNEELELDFLADTLDFVDEFLQRFSEEGLTVNDFAETITVAGV